MKVLRNYREPIRIEHLTSIGLTVATILALLVYNSPLKSYYDYLLNNIYILKKLSIHNFINDFLMSIFFFVAGLEIKHEILYGNLSTFKKASFPIVASIGGVILPAAIYMLFNRGTDFVNGFCIPISTDIAFAVGIYLIFSKNFNPSLKIFLLSLAVVDDLISIIAIGSIYAIDIKLAYVIIAILILLMLFVANKVCHIESVLYYSISGLCVWYFVHLSGIHSTLSGILLASVIPSKSQVNKDSCLEKIQNILVPFNSLIVMPLFAFANTGITISNNINIDDHKSLIFGIVIGLCVGKPIGIISFGYIGNLLGITEKPKNISWIGIFFVSMIAGIGFTMSIFVSEIAFNNNIELINIAKASILISCIVSIIASFISISVYIFFKRFTSKNTSNLFNSYYIN